MVVVQRSHHQPTYQGQGRARPFLKWAGGKSGLVRQLLPFVPPRFSGYYEPFLGGGGFYFGLGDRVKDAFLSDVNRELIAVWQAVQASPQPLIERLLEHRDRHSRVYYLQVRGQAKSADPIENASRFIYLNKTCYNGLYRVNRRGEFNVPIGRYRNPTICDPLNLQAVSQALRAARLSVCDFRTIAVKSGDFIYCDPPYDGTFNSYTRDKFGQEGQRDLRRAADRWRDSGAQVMISNADTAFIRALYCDYMIHPIRGPRSISCDKDQRKPVSELVITSY